MQTTRCLNCRHYLFGWRCEAFPDGIPAEIRLGENDHSEPVEGDSGITFEPIEGAEDEGITDE